MIKLGGIIGIALSLVLGGHAVANDCGPNGSGDVLELSEWDVTVAPDRMGRMTAQTSWTVVNRTSQDIRMVDGLVILTDALGGYISNASIPRDLRVAPGEPFSWSAEYGGTGIERVATLEPSEFSVVACVKAILYSDGSKVEY